MTPRLRSTLFAATLAAAIGLVVLGVFHDEMGEVMFNACMLCLSCIGMG